MARSTERESSEGSGFLAHLKGLSVPDLVQMNCLSGAVCSVRVNSHERVGWLHFSGGNIVHAETGALTGDEAVLEIVQWQDGTLEPSSAEIPARVSVQSSWQNLMLTAAQQRDEMRRGNVVPIAQRVGNAGPITVRAAAVPPNVIPQAHAALTSPLGTNRGLTAAPLGNGRVAANPTQSSARVAVSPPPSSARVAASLSAGSGRVAATASFTRLDASGRVLTSRGDVEELSAMAAFSAHIGQWIANHLGLDQFQGLDLRADKQRTIVAVHADGQVEAMNSDSDAELAVLVRSAGF